MNIWNNMVPVNLFVSTANFMKSKYMSSISTKNFSVQIEMDCKGKTQTRFQKHYKKVNYLIKKL